MYSTGYPHCGYIKWVGLPSLRHWQMWLLCLFVLYYPIMYTVDFQTVSFFRNGRFNEIEYFFRTAVIACTFVDIT